MCDIKEGSRFESFDVLEQALKDYCDTNGVILSKAESRLLHPPKYSEAICKRFKYKLVFYCCKYGASLYKRRSVSGAQTVNSRLNCPALIRLIFVQERDGISYLEISKFCDEHNHAPGDLMPTLSMNDLIKNELTLALSTNENSEMSSEFFGELTNGELIVDSLETSNNFSKHIEQNNPLSVKTGLLMNNVANSQQLLSTLEKIKNAPGLTLEIYLESNNLLSVYFQTDEMRFYLNTYPEILMIDNITYYDDSAISIYALLIVDGKGQAQIVCIWVILLETYEIVYQMCELLKKYNENWNKIQILIIEKDPPNTKVYQDCFPHSQIEINPAHVIKAFKRDIVPNNCGMTVDQIKIVIDLLKELAEAESISAFQALHNRIIQFNCLPINVYLEEYWLNQKSLWSTAWRANRMSSIIPTVTHRRGGYMQVKLRPALVNYTSFARFLEDLVAFSNLLSSKRDYDATLLCIKRQPNSHSPGTPEYLYRDLLLDYGFDMIFREYKEFPLEIVDSNNISGSSTTRTPTNCNCEFYLAFHLPCRHIFALRQALGLNLYLETLCEERWTLEYFRKHRRNYMLKKQDTALASSSHASTGIHQPPKLAPPNDLALHASHVRDKLIESIKAHNKDLVKSIQRLPTEKLVPYLTHFKHLIQLCQKGEIPVTQSTLTAYLPVENSYDFNNKLSFNNNNNNNNNNNKTDTNNIAMYSKLNNNITLPADNIGRMSDLMNAIQR